MAISRSIDYNRPVSTVVLSLNNWIISFKNVELILFSWIIHDLKIVYLSADK